MQGQVLVVDLILVRRQRPSVDGDRFEREVLPVQDQGRAGGAPYPQRGANPGFIGIQVEVQRRVLDPVRVWLIVAAGNGFGGVIGHGEAMKEEVWTREKERRVGE